ncbi:hypothetical protein V3851_01190 [Paenibacillus sp. M1]|uniref:Tetratricopeptide repeat protein n=1 Tax=Paenibacillus haidiansis TaxID=1574488 RepID=A0ABU7VKY7_9BACL
MQYDDIKTLYRLGEYKNALSTFSAALPQDEELCLIYLECLFHCGKIQTALQVIRDWKSERGQQSSEPFLVSLEELSFLGQACLETGSGKTRIPVDARLLNQGVIRRAVGLGLLEAARKLAVEADNTYFWCEFIQSLYEEGYTEKAKAGLSGLDLSLLAGDRPSFRNVAFIFAEILHDEGRFEEAAPIFERLAEGSPEMARARFAACSCYLQTTMNHLLGRVELYRPGEEEQRKIEQYLNNITEALRIIDSTNWHTVWSVAQSRNLPASTSGTLQ